MIVSRSRQYKGKGLSTYYVFLKKGSNVLRIIRITGRVSGVLSASLPLLAQEDPQHEVMLRITYYDLLYVAYYTTYSYWPTLVHKGSSAPEALRGLVAAMVLGRGSGVRSGWAREYFTNSR
eukprot:8740145-Pyramimonas_sp.AAC.1